MLIFEEQVKVPKRTSAGELNTFMLLYSGIDVPGRPALTEKLSLCECLMNMLRIFCEQYCSQ